MVKAHLRSLDSEGKVAEAVDQSLAMDAASRERLHPACFQDAPHVGEGSISTTIATPSSRGSDPSARPVVASFIALHAADGAATATSSSKILLPLTRTIAQASAHLGRGLREAVVGFSLDGAFVAAESPLRCEAASVHNKAAGTSNGGSSYASAAEAADRAHAFGLGLVCRGGGGVTVEAKDGLAALAQHRASASASGRRLDRTYKGAPFVSPVDDDGAIAKGFDFTEVDNNYARQEQKVLVMPIYPQDATNGLTQPAPYGYCYGLVKGVHGCTDDGVAAFFAAVMQLNGDFYESASWGVLSFKPTIMAPMQVAYDGATCNRYNALSKGPDPGSWDGMAINAARSRGQNPINFAMWLVFIPKCDLEYSGIGKLGEPGSLLNLGGSSYGASVAHEMGHNYGANHASVMDGKSRGAVAWADAPNTWVEYGNPHSVMGNGDETMFAADFMLPLKLVFDWIGERDVVRVTPFDAMGVGGCDHAGS